MKKKNEVGAPPSSRMHMGDDDDDDVIEDAEEMTLGELRIIIRDLLREMNND